MKLFKGSMVNHFNIFLLKGVIHPRLMLKACWKANCDTSKAKLADYLGESDSVEPFTNWFRLHYAVQHELEKPFGFLWLFSAEHRTYNNTLYLYYIQTCGGKLEQSWATVYTEYCQNRGQKKPAWKNPDREKNSAGNLGRIHGSCSEKPIQRRLHGWKVFALIY